MDPFAALDRATAAFDAKVRAIPDDAWDRPTPCPDWSVRALVAHVVGGNLMTAALFDGCGRDEALAAVRGYRLGPDPYADWQASAKTQVEAFRGTGAMERVVHHPSTDMTGTILYGFRLTDLVLHGWDLARGVELDDAIDPELAAFILPGLSQAAPMLVASGMFGAGASGAVPVDADPAARLLDVTGRRP